MGKVKKPARQAPLLEIAPGEDISQQELLISLAQLLQRFEERFAPLAAAVEAILPEVPPSASKKKRGQCQRARDALMRLGMGLVVAEARGLHRARLTARPRTRHPRSKSVERLDTSAREWLEEWREDGADERKRALAETIKRFLPQLRAAAQAEPPRRPCGRPRLGPGRPELVRQWRYLGATDAEARAIVSVLR